MGDIAFKFRDLVIIKGIPVELPAGFIPLEPLTKLVNCVGEFSHVSDWGNTKGIRAFVTTQTCIRGHITGDPSQLIDEDFFWFRLDDLELIL